MLCPSGFVKEFLSILKDHPGLDVNWNGCGNGWTYLLHLASFKGHVEIVKLLLAHPDIDIHLQDFMGQTPFSMSCDSGRFSIVKVFLKDLRVDISQDDDYGCTPLW